MSECSSSMILALVTLTDIKTSTKTKVASMEFLRGNLKMTAKTYRHHFVNKGGKNNRNEKTCCLKGRICCNVLHH